MKYFIYHVTRRVVKQTNLFLYLLGGVIYLFFLEEKQKSTSKKFSAYLTMACYFAFPAVLDSSFNSLWR